MKSFQKQNANFITIIFIIILILFIILIKDYIITLILAALFSGIIFPFYQKLTQWLKGRQSMSAVITTLFFFLIIIIPSFYLIAEIVNQASQVSGKLINVVTEEFQNSDGLQSNTLPDWFPMKETLKPYTHEIYAKAGQIAEKIVGIIVNGLGNVTTGTFAFILSLFIMLYAMYFFLRNGVSMVNKAAYYLPLTEKQFNTMRNEMVSTARATIKGAGVIGIIQGALVGIIFAIVGIPGALFWGAVSAFASLIPSVGCALIYVPAGLFLIFTGQTSNGILVLAWGFLIVGTVDNLLRPILVGKDTQLSELMVLISTLGGISLFGLSGVVLGPIIASFMATMAKLYTDETS